MTQIIIYVAVLSVLTTISYCQKPRPLQRKSQNDFSFSNFVKESFFYLNVEVVARSFENNPVLCWLKCLDVLSCFSVNVASSKDSESKFWCELLVTDKYNAPDKFLPNSSSHHYSISSQCENSPCLNNGTCLPNYSDDTYTCICAVGYIGSRCKQACHSALGMEDGRIQNHQLTASSEYSADLKAYHARLNQVVPGSSGCWSPQYLSVDQYLQVRQTDGRTEISQPHSPTTVDLEKAKYITMVAAQGRALEGGVYTGHYQWVKTYGLKYSDDGTNWTDYSEGGVIKIFSGNTDSGTVARRGLVEPIKARYIRFLVKSWHGHPSMRAELYGCEP
ncbi:EGF-like repeat and discoidin I-like domain-containing protein 3 [Nematostella vectensis]|uniref:EGF-like repeat and discoidin I-like domain-containing protein 3 n=1 Tax=Nematostella vectensis TaxID=45351 RepID=UPI0020773DFA|nr:EGF-like repeat and discoidin I-like domain-containing protein 3 [Nematostella vectensis]